MMTLSLASTTEKIFLMNIHQLYLHDLSQYTNQLKLNDKGLFENDDIEKFYEKDHLIPYLIKVNDVMIGFILFCLPPNTPEEYDYYISDVFILKAYRNQGFAKKAVSMLLDYRQGRYSVLVLKDNIEGTEFWQKFFNDNYLAFSEVEMNIDDDLCVFYGFEII